MRVLIIPEDFTFDQHILKPLVEALFAHLGKPRVKVVVYQDVRMGSVTQALKWENVEQALQQYRMIDLFLLCVDRDGVDGRRQQLDSLEDQAQAVLGGNRRLLAENAWQEVEVWAIAGHDIPANWRFQVIRDDLHPKENYFFPLAPQQGLPNDPQIIYKELGYTGAKRYSQRIRLRCDEIADLESRISQWLNQ